MEKSDENKHIGNIPKPFLSFPTISLIKDKELKQAHTKAPPAIIILKKKIYELSNFDSSFILLYF